jgi:hypothetical protein
MVVSLSALHAGRKILTLNSVRGFVDPWAIVWLEELDKLKDAMN